MSDYAAAITGQNVRARDRLVRALRGEEPVERKRDERCTHGMVRAWCAECTKTGTLRCKA